MKRILRAWRAARKALSFEGFRGLWDRIRCGRKSGLVRLPRLESRVRIPSPALIRHSNLQVVMVVARCMGWPLTRLIHRYRPTRPGFAVDAGVRRAFS
jgi:hypothetical protein